MEINKCIKDSFAVIGKEGSTTDGEGFIHKLWHDANANFHEIEHLAKRDNNGHIIGIWGAMSDFSRSFSPWEGGSKGLYLAGVECQEDAATPAGWVKWVIPGYEYIYVENHSNDTFLNVMAYLRESNLRLAGAVHDYNCPADGKAYMFFPIKKL